MDRTNAKFAVFVDRDGTICYDKHYLADPDGLELIPTVLEGMKALTEAGIPVIIITNQSGVARGHFTEQRLAEIHEHLKEILASRGAKVEDIFHCPHMPDAGCPCRKPAPGMILRARDRHGLDLTKSFMIGDRMMDVEMAHAVGAIAVLVPEPGDQYHVAEEMARSKDKPDVQVASFSEAVTWILRRINVRQPS